MSKSERYATAIDKMILHCFSESPVENGDVNDQMCPICGLPLHVTPEEYCKLKDAKREPYITRRCLVCEIIEVENVWFAPRDWFVIYDLPELNRRLRLISEIAKAKA